MEKKDDIIRPRPWSYDTFPSSTAMTEGIKTLAADDRRRSCSIHIQVEYARKSGRPLHLNIIEPKQAEGENHRFPLIVYIQGSAWFPQDMGAELAQLARFAQRGFVIAVVEYRPSTEAPFPAQVKDAKTALRYLKKHAAAYHADGQKPILWGDSSGGHTAVMVGVSLYRAELDDESPVNDPISVNAVIDYYGPTDISLMCREPSTIDHILPNSPEGMLIGGFNVLENPERVEATNPMNYLAEGEIIPPILIMHGDKDRLVPFGQSVLLFDALKKANCVAECYRLKGADHGGPPFWTEAVFDLVENFIEKYA